MNLNEPLLRQLKHEAEGTRKMLERAPAEHYNWKPHEKSMTLGGLAAHIAEINGWLNATVEADELDFEKLNYKPKVFEDAMALLKFYDDTLAKGLLALQTASDENLRGDWKLRNGERIFFTMPRVAVIRTMVLSHTIHHRGQLSVYLRMLNVPLPGLYGPTADEPAM